MGQLVSGLDEQDPYWTLAYMNQQWYFASTGNTKLMGPYMDGSNTLTGNEITGDEALKLLYQLDLTTPQAGLYNYAILKRNGS